jgi:phage terminase large subunit
MIKDIVEEWGLEEEFTFTTHPLRIRCSNGNSFLARGCDDAGKMKSITNPTHAWYEEGNQLTLDDYTISSSTLRGKRRRTKVQQWFSFNPEAAGSYEDFWLYKTFFKGHKEPSFESVTNIEVKVGTETKIVPIKYTSTHTTYNDNPHCSDIRRALLENLQNINPHFHKVFTLGMWGNKANDAPFAFAFDRAKHLGSVCRILGAPLIASFDFNRNPITCLVSQILPGDKIRCIEQIKLPNSDIYKLCDYLKLHYPGALWVITGDATGNGSNAMVRDGLNYYKIIKAEMNLSRGQFKVPTVNPNIEENQVLINAVLAVCDVKMDEKNCAALTFDMENVAMLPSGGIDKSNRDNPTMQADALDTFRYLCNVFMKHILKVVAYKNGREEYRKAA